MTIDMSDFEAQFGGNRLSSEMSDETFEHMADVRDRMAELSDLINFRKEMLTFRDSDLADLERMKRSLEEVIAEIRSRRNAIESGRSAERWYIREDTRKLEQLQREWARILAELAARKRFNDQKDEIDYATANCPWRVGVDGKRALPHQFEGAYRVTSARRALLCDKPGLGKTLQAIMIVDMLREMGHTRKVLIVTPKQVLKGFEREFERWSPNQFVHVLNHAGKDVKSDVLDLVAHLHEAVIITNYEVWRLHKVIKDKLKAAQFDTVILDEAHKCKTEKSVTFQTVREIVYAENQCSNCGSPLVSVGMCGKCGTHQKEFGEFCSVKNFVALTGTPILNRPPDLWPLLNLTDRKAFPDVSAFLRDYCIQKYNSETDRTYWAFKPGGSEALLKKLGMKYTSRSRDSAGVKMPPQEVRHHELEFTAELYPRQFEFVKLLKESARLKFGDDRQVTMNETLAWYTRMRQSATWPDGIVIKEYAVDQYGEKVLDDDGKPIIVRETSPSVGESVIMDAGEAITLENVEAGDRIVVFSKFKPALIEFERRMKEAKIRVARFDGDTRQNMRQEILDDFDTKMTKVGDHKYDVLLVNYDAASEGVNLHGAHQIVILDREWNPGREEQTMDRLRRIDSEFNSIVHILHAEGTATDLMDALIDEKRAIIDGFEAEVNLQEAMRKFLEGK